MSKCGHPEKGLTCGPECDATKGFKKAFDDARERGETRCSVCLSSAHSKEYHVGTRQPTPAEEAYGKTLIPLAEEALAASGELPTVNQATSQGGIPPYTPAASGGALSAEQAREIFIDLAEYPSAVNWQEKADRLNAALAAHDQKVREPRVTLEQIRDLPDAERPCSVMIGFHDGHIVKAEGEGALEFYRAMLDGRKRAEEEQKP